MLMDSDKTKAKAQGKLSYEALSVQGALGSIPNTANNSNNTLALSAWKCCVGPLEQVRNCSYWR